MFHVFKVLLSLVILVHIANHGLKKVAILVFFFSLSHTH